MQTAIRFSASGDGAGAWTAVNAQQQVLGPMEASVERRGVLNKKRLRQLCRPKTNPYPAYPRPRSQIAVPGLQGGPCG